MRPRPREEHPLLSVHHSGGHCLLETIWSSCLHFLLSPSSSSVSQEPSKPEPREKAEKPSPRGAPPSRPHQPRFLRSCQRARARKKSDFSHFLRNKSHPESQLCPNIS